MEATLLANLAQAPYRFKDETPKPQQNNNNSSNGWYISTNNMSGFPPPAPVRSSPVKADPPTENKEQMEEEDGSEEDYTEEPVNDDNEDSKDDEDFVVMNTKFRKKPKPPVNRNNAIPKTPKKQRVCDFCGANDTPMWRRGPQGKGTLCNACGVKWSLKFRKRIPKKKDGKEPSDKSNGKMREREAPREKTLSSTRKIRSPSPTQMKKLRSRGGSSPSSPEPERDCGIITIEGDYKEYYCKYCGLTWPLSYFKNTQQFGAHCSNCSRKQRGTGPMNDSETGESSRDLELDYFSAVRLHKRKRELEGISDWAEDSDEEMDAGVNVLGKLLNVVESQLMEEEKLDEIRNEIRVFKTELLTKEDVRRKLIEEVRFSVAGELLEFRRDLINKIQAREAHMNGIFDQTTVKFVSEFKNGTDSLKELIKSAQDSLTDKPEALQKLSTLETSLMEVQKKVENQAEEMKAKIATELKNSTVNFAFAIDAKKERIHNEIEGMKRGADSNSADTHFYLNRIEASIEHATNKAVASHAEPPKASSDAQPEKPVEM